MNRGLSPVAIVVGVVLVNLALPIAVAKLAPATLDRGTHEGRNDVKYFAIPWKHREHSCDVYVKRHGLDQSWDGYEPAPASAPNATGKVGG